MWKPLTFGQNVCVGDKIRYTNTALSYHQQVHQVEQTEQYYFVLTPETPGNTTSRMPHKKVVRHFDVQHYITLERWIDAGQYGGQA